MVFFPVPFLTVIASLHHSSHQSSFAEPDALSNVGHHSLQHSPSTPSTLALTSLIQNQNCLELRMKWRQQFQIQSNNRSI